MHDGAPAYKAKVVTKFLNDQNINVLKWPGNLPDLNAIKNVWNFLKNNVQETRPSNINDFKKALMSLWETIDST